MRTPSSKAKRRPVRGRATKKNGRTGKGVQRWKRPACRLSSTMPQRRRGRERTLEELLSRLPGPSSQRAADSAGDARALRKRIAWCRRVRPRIAPPDARRHTVMADGTYMGHGWRLIIAIDGRTGEVLDRQWRACEWVCYMKTAHPRPESFIPDALRKGEKATTPEPDDSVAPAYGTGIDRNEFHTTTRYPNTTD
ncbi:hypothetical protein [Bifidobacterium longum]|uniref:hypothetical protein n=1 Tax=Bifidobacterium longum TaxID=216816 RepID=UPI0009C09618|nr:hypothetical protein [Bifidobacterium longum]